MQKALPYRFWTKEEDAELYHLWARHLGEDRPIQKIARRMGRSVNAIRCRIRDLGWKMEAMGVLHMADIARILNRDCVTVLRWIRSGYFPTLHAHKRRNCYAITEDELWTWMEDPAYWHLWEPETLVDLALREHFTELRAGWIDTNQVAEMLCISPKCVRDLHRARKIESMKKGLRIWFRQEAVERYRQMVYE